MKRHPSWDVLDASKTQEFMDCPRKFFYRYILGWTSDRISHHLVYGDAMHQAMEYLMNNGTVAENVSEAHKIFTRVYRESFPDEETDSARGAKTPTYALGLLIEYTAKYETIDKNLKVHHVEVADCVPIDLLGGTKLMHFRIDVIVEDQYGLWVMDHKTHGPLNDYQRTTWIKQWYTNFQMGLYTHVLYCLYDSKDIRGAMINALEVKKPTKADLADGRLVGGQFERILADRSPEMMQVWLYDALHWYDRIQQEMDNLEDTSTNDNVMEAFPRCSQACTKYFGCPYIEFCSAWQNPLREAERFGKGEAPPNMMVKWWDPREKELESKKVITGGN